MDTTPMYNRPWFWAAILALIAVLVFGIVIFASSPNREAEGTTTVVQAPPPPPAETTPSVVPVPQPTIPPVVSTPPPVSVAPPPPARPAPAVQPPPQVIREKTVVIREKAPKPAPAPKATPKPAPAPSVPPGPAPSNKFGATGLPKEVSFNQSQWQASKTMTIQNADQTLKQAGTTDDGTAIFVSVNAQEPYLTILCAVPDEDGKFVEYRKR